MEGLPKKWLDRKTSCLLVQRYGSQRSILCGRIKKDKVIWGEVDHGIKNACSGFNSAPRLGYVVENSIRAAPGRRCGIRLMTDAALNDRCWEVCPPCLIPPNSAAPIPPV